jgi:hypothetical protein
MKFASATELNRKSGEAQWRDLLFFFFCHFSRRLFSPYLPGQRVFPAAREAELCGQL